MSLTLSALPHASPQPPAVLAFAGSDPTGGAGLQADLLTLSNLGCYGLTVATDQTPVVLL